LPFLNLMYNQTPRGATTYSPQEVMFGGVIGNVAPCVDLSHPVLTNEYLAHIRKAQEISWAVISELRNKQLGPEKGKAIEHSFKPGDYVLVRRRQGDARGQHKLQSKFRGPYRVMRAYPGTLLVMPYQLGTSLEDTEALAPGLEIEGERSSLKQDMVPLRDCKRYEGEIPPIPTINVKRARELLRELGVSTELMDGPEGNAMLPSATDLGPDNVSEAEPDADEKEDLTPITAAEVPARRPRGRPPKQRDLHKGDASQKPEAREPEKDSLPTLDRPPEGQDRPWGRTRSATRLREIAQTNATKAIGAERQ
jgi:hypothetical protein